MTGAVMAAASSMFGVTITVSAISESGSSSSPTVCSAGLRVLQSGSLETGFSNTSSSPSYVAVTDEWIIPQVGTPGDDYEARLVTITGSLSTGLADTWQALSTDREYNVFTGAGSVSFTGTLEIRRASDAYLVASGSVSLSATAS